MDTEDGIATSWAGDADRLTAKLMMALLPLRSIRQAIWRPPYSKNLLGLICIRIGASTVSVFPTVPWAVTALIVTEVSADTGCVSTEKLAVCPVTIPEKLPMLATLERLLVKDTDRPLGGRSPVR